MHDIPADAVTRYALSRFVTGDENHLAFATVHTLARGLASAHFPLVITGRSGTGVTHLAVGFAVFVEHVTPSLVVRYRDLPSWLLAVASMPVAGREQAMQALQTADVIVLDGLAALSRAPSSIRSQVIDMVLARLAANRPVVVTDVRTPTDDPALDPRLRGVMLRATVVSLAPFGEQLTRQILLRWAHERGMILPPEAVDSIAAGITDGHRLGVHWGSFVAMQPTVLPRTAVPSAAFTELVSSVADLVSGTAAAMAHSDAVASARTPDRIAVELARLRAAMIANAGGAVADISLLQVDTIPWDAERWDDVVSPLEALWP